MLKHILTGQPSSTAGSRLQHHEFLAAGAAGPSGLQHHQHQSHGLREQLRAGGRAQSSADVYDNVGAAQPGCPAALGQRAAPQLQPGQRHHPLNHSLNHSQLSVNNLAHRLNASQHSHHALNLSTLSTSKHSVNSASPVVGPGLGYAERASQRNNLSMLGQTQALLAQLREHQLLERERSKPNGGLDISRASRLPSQATPSPAQPATATPAGAAPTATAAPSASTGPSIVPLNVSWSSSELSRQHKSSSLEAGVKEMLTSLGLLCLVSLLLALLSLTFLVKMTSVSPVPNGNSLISLEEFAIVHDVTLVLCALALSLNLCCLLVCAIQFLFAVKLVKSSYHGHRTNKYLQKSSISRVCAVGGFFISIPVFLTGMILYTFIQFQSTPAIVTSVFIGLGIVFCGCALVHTVFVWQKEKTNAMKALRREQYEAAAQLQRQQTLHSQQQQHQPQQSHSQQSQQSHQQQQQQQQQQQPRSLPANYGVASRLAGHEQLASGSVGPLSLSGAHPRGLAAQQQLHQLHNHRHVSMSPPLLLSSTANGLHHGPSQRGPLSQSLLGPASPPATPGDRSPTSPANKHNRSQMSREAATGSVSPGLPAATLDLSSAANTNSPHELSTLV